MKSLTTLLIAGTLMACHSSRQSGSASASADTRLHDIWALQTLNGHDIRAESFQRGVPNLELHVSDGRAMGFGGCNQFNGAAAFERDTIRFGALAATRMACIGAGGDVENGLFEVLKGAVGYRLDGLSLTLAGKGGVAVFKKVD